jgi:hypothetical protein
VAIKVSTNLLKSRNLFFSLRYAPFLTLHFRLKRFLSEKRRLYKRKKLILKLKAPPTSAMIKFALGENLKLNNLTKYKKQYKSKNFSFIENFFDTNAHNQLCDSFPNEVFFDYPRTGEKFYRWADELSWVRDNNTTTFNSSNGIEFFDIYPFYRNFYDFLNSTEVAETVKILTDSQSAELYSILLNRCQEGSFLVPHQDTVAKNIKSGDKKMINIIYFLLAGGGSPENSGGTGIYNDNEFNSPKFIPTNLRNSALIYNSTASFYHGFDVMSPGSFRWAITIQFKIS